MNGLHIIKYPTGRYGFVGRVPQCLGHEGHPDDLAAARTSGPGIARRIAARNGREFTTLVWDTAEAAQAAALAKGFVVELPV